MKLAWTVESPASDGSKTQLSQSCGSNGVAMRSSSRYIQAKWVSPWGAGPTDGILSHKARARRERIRERASRIAASLLPTAGLLVAVYAVAYMLAARRRRRERVAATEFKAKVAPYLVEAPEL